MTPLQLVITHKIEFESPQVLAALTDLATRITKMEGTLVKTMNNIDTAIAALTVQVQNNTTVDTSVVTFINGIPALIAAAVANAVNAGATPAQVQAFTDLGTSIQTSSDSVVAAIKANTPVQPPVVEPPAGGTTPPPVV